MEVRGAEAGRRSGGAPTSAWRRAGGKGALHSGPHFMEAEAVGGL